MDGPRLTRAESAAEIRLTCQPLSLNAGPRKMCVRSLAVTRQAADSKCRKSIQFGLMSNQEIQQVAEFHVFERNLYQLPQRQPLKNGILDQRLASTCARH